MRGMTLSNMPFYRASTTAPTVTRKTYHEQKKVPLLGRRLLSNF